MSNSTTLLDLITANQASKEVTANALYDALSQAAIFGRRASTTAGLTWGYYGGRYTKSDNTTMAVANATLALTGSATNYIEANPATGAVSVNTSAFTVGRTPLYSVVTGVSTVTSYTDYRDGTQGNGGVAPGALDHSDISDFGEAVEDIVGAMATAGSGLTVAYDDGSPARLTLSLAAQPFDVAGFFSGIPSASALVIRIPLARAVSFPANFSGSHGVAGTAATASTVFDVQKNGASIGSITFAIAGTVATFTTTGGTSKSFVAGDILSIVAPASPDATLADFGFVLAGTR